MQMKSPAEDPQYDYYFNLLYTVYSLPNLLLPLIMGLATDRWGWRFLICGLSACVVLGNVVLSIGVGFGSWPTMIAGRVLFGLGGESIQVAQNCLLFRWFKGGELAFALAVNLSVARSGSVFNDFLSPWVAGRWGVHAAVGFGTLLCLGSFVCNVWSVIVDKAEGDRLDQRRQLENAETNEDHMSLRDVFNMPRITFLLIAFSVVMYCGIIPFNNVASAFFVETTFNHLPLAQAQQKAGNAMSFMFLIVVLGMAPLGAVVDFVGLRTQFLFISAVLLPLTYFAVFSVSPVVTMLNLGVVYTIFAGVWWPTLALTVPKRQLGTAFGLATALQNGGLALVPLLIGHLQVSAGQGHFNRIMQLLIRLGLAGVVFSLLIMRENAVSTKVLSLPSKQIQPESERLVERQSIEAPDETSGLLVSKCSASKRDQVVFSEA